MKTLHFRRRYNWGIFVKNHRRALALLGIAAALSLMLHLWHAALQMEIGKIEAQNEARTVAGLHLWAVTFGAPKTGDIVLAKIAAPK
jgi:hypothetical protein